MSDRPNTDKQESTAANQAYIHQCFVIQPLSDDYKRRYDDVYKPALERNFVPYRVDLDRGPGNVIDKIKNGIERSSIYFADISEDNANVWFELGYAFSTARPIVMVCSEKRNPCGIADLPFDVKVESVVFYDSRVLDDDSHSDNAKERERIENAIVDISTSDFDRLRSRTGYNRSFWHWCSKNMTNLSSHVNQTVDFGSLLSPPHYYRMGDAVLLLGSMYPYGYPDEIIPAPQTPGYDLRFARSVERVLSKEDFGAWFSKVKEFESEDMVGNKLRVTRVLADYTDAPQLRVETELVNYRETKAFHDHLAQSPALAKRYCRKALDIFGNEGTGLPNIIVSHAIVIFGPTNDDLWLLLAHRTPVERDDGYSPGSWSVSFEEQYSPTPDRIGDVVKPVDKSVLDSVRRGVMEEFLGDDYPVRKIDVSIQGLVMEARILNFAFLAVVRIRDSFEDLKKRWAGAVDRREHREIAALPFDKDTLTACLQDECLPECIHSTLEKDTAEQDIRGSWGERNKWHPTSPMRMALALWHHEMLASKSPK